MDDELQKMLERNFIYYHTAPKCPFCGGYMLPLSYLADAHGSKRSRVWFYEGNSGELKACNCCGIVKYYPDEES